MAEEDKWKPDAEVGEEEEDELDDTVCELHLWTE